MGAVGQRWIWHFGFGQFCKAPPNYRRAAPFTLICCINSPFRVGRLIIWPTGTVDNNPDDDDIDYIALMMTTLSRSIPKSGTNHSLLAERGGVQTSKESHPGGL